MLPLKIKNEQEALSLVQKNAYTFKKLPTVYKNNKKIIIAAIKSIPSLFKDLDEQYKNDKDIALVGVQKDANNLKYIPKLHYDYDIVLMAAKKSGVALQHAPFWNNDYDIAEAAIKSHPKSFEYLSSTLKYDKFLISLALDKINPFESYFIYEQLADFLKEDPEIIGKMLFNSNQNWECIPEKIRNNRELNIYYLLKEPLILNSRLFYFDADTDEEVLFNYIKGIKNVINRKIETNQHNKEDSEIAQYKGFLDYHVLIDSFPKTFNKDKFTSLDEFIAHCENKYLILEQENINLIKNKKNLIL